MPVTSTLCSKKSEKELEETGGREALEELQNLDALDVEDTVDVQEPELECFSWSCANRFVFQEINEKSSCYLSPQEAQKLGELQLRRDRNQLIDRLLFELSELSAALDIDGVTKNGPTAVDLKEWATGRAALLPVPFEELVLPIKADEELLSSSDIEQEIEEREKEIRRLTKKYVRGLFLFDYSDDSDDLKLLSSPTAKGVALWAFDVLVDGLAEAYDYLHGNDKACVLEALVYACNVRGVIEYFGDGSAKNGRPRLEKRLEKSDSLLRTVARIKAKHPKAPDSKLKAFVVIERGCCDRTVERALKRYAKLPPEEQARLEAEEAAK